MTKRDIWTNRDERTEKVRDKDRQNVRDIERQRQMG